MNNYWFGVLLILMFAAGCIGHKFLSSNNSTLLPPQGLQQGSSQTTIYQAPEQSFGEPMLVRRVSLIQERPAQLMLELEYTYQGSIPAEQIKLFIYMNSAYTYIGSIDVLKGTHIRRLIIGLNETAMKKDQRYEFTTHNITVSFEHYLPNKYMGVITRTAFPFEKRWLLIE
jgi:hypothetical protein